MRSKNDSVKYTIDMHCSLIRELSDLVLLMRSEGTIGMSKSLLLKASAYYLIDQAKKGNMGKIMDMVDKYIESNVNSNNAIKRVKHVLR